MGDFLRLAACQSLSLWERCRRRRRRGQARRERAAGAAIGRLFIRAILSQCRAVCQQPSPLSLVTLLLASSPKGGAIGMSVRLSFVQPLSLASLDSSPSRGASGGEENFELGRKTLRNAKASPR